MYSTVDERIFRDFDVFWLDEKELSSLFVSLETDEVGTMWFFQHPPCIHNESCLNREDSLSFFFHNRFHFAMKSINLLSISWWTSSNKTSCTYAMQQNRQMCKQLTGMPCCASVPRVCLQSVKYSWILKRLIRLRWLRLQSLAHWSFHSDQIQLSPKASFSLRARKGDRIARW